MIHWVLSDSVSITCTDEIETVLNNSGQMVKSQMGGASKGH